MGLQWPGDLLMGPGPAVLMPAWHSFHCLLGRHELPDVCWLRGGFQAYQGDMGQHRREAR